ncbi:hypothetical protein B0T20DRAFT_393292 [Sordaria brevicollis]|uniref:Uncharacterized protein n=1 Tax=Sordaria brevicollis TaxID=83679 RepID=A0AAE0PCM2_SORBR|nr:hypothetical protein B0T20DRAFT_393292 [Sordaria brevicollis]
MAKKKNKGKNTAIVGEFARYFGDNTLENWHRLIRDIGLDENPPTINKCRQVIKKVNVNIYDLLEAVAQGTHPQHFGTIGLLAQYSIRNRKIYPSQMAKKDKVGPVRALLRGLFGGS